MADYWTHFSFVIPKPITGEEREWLMAALIEPAWPPPPDATDDATKPWIEDGFIAFNHSFEDDGNLWLFTSETGDPTAVSLLLEAFLTRFRPTGVIGFQWAETCSKPRLDAYGGGACVVYGDGHPTDWISTAQWIAERTPTMIEPAPLSR